MSGLLGGVIKTLGRELQQEVLSRPMANALNKRPLFYKGPHGQVAEAVKGAGEILVNTTMQEINPKRSQLFTDTGISYGTQKSVKKAFERYKELNKKVKRGEELSDSIFNDEVYDYNKAGQIITGQLGYNDLVTSQMGKDSTIGQLYRPTSYLGKGYFTPSEFKSVQNLNKPWELEDILSTKDMERFYKHIGNQQGIDPLKENVQMFVKQPSARAAGNFDNDVNRLASNRIKVRSRFKARGSEYESIDDLVLDIRAYNLGYSNKKITETPTEKLKALVEKDEQAVKDYNPWEGEGKVPKHTKPIRILEVDEDGNLWIADGVKSSGFVEGGVNVVTKIDRKGNAISMVSDEHDMFGIKPITGERGITIVPPIMSNFLKPKREIKEAYKKQEYKRDVERKKASLERMKVLEEIRELSGSDYNPPTNLNKDQHLAAKIIMEAKGRDMSPSDYLKWLLRSGATLGSLYSLYGLGGYAGYKAMSNLNEAFNPWDRSLTGRMLSGEKP